MVTIQKVLDRKGREVWTIRPDETVFDAIEKMADKNIGALVVIEDDKIIGMFTERHYAREVFLKGRSAPDTSIREVMKFPVCFALPDQTIEECMAVMTKNRVRHLPVMEDDRLIGLISIGDLVNTTIADQKFTIEQLEHYIHG